jgi:hypothetical protein
MTKGWGHEELRDSRRPARTETVVEEESMALGAVTKQRLVNTANWDDLVCAVVIC